MSDNTPAIQPKPKKHVGKTYDQAKADISIKTEVKPVLKRHIGKTFADIQAETPVEPTPIIFGDIRGRVERMLADPLAKAKPPCPHYQDCGGCQLQHVAYPYQLELKTEIVKEALGARGLDTSLVLSTIGAKEQYHYRSKVQMVFSEKGRKIQSGFYEENTHRIVNVDACAVHDDQSNAIIRTCKALFIKHKIPPFREDVGLGLIRHVMIKSSLATKQVLVAIVTISEVFPGRNNFVTELRQLHPEITTIVQNVNARQTSAVLGEFERIIYGPGYIEDVLLGKKFIVSAKSFYQVNPRQTEILYSKAMEFAKPKATDVIVDAYSGVGTIGIFFADKVKQVFAVEINPVSVKLAIQNARLNNIRNIRFTKDDAVTFIAGIIHDEIHIDIVVVDPPRTGLDKAFIDNVLQLKPEKIVYVSCDPLTLARDVRFLTDGGYVMKRVQPVDMFCQTFHVETVSLLSLKSV